MILFSLFLLLSVAELKAARLKPKLTIHQPVDDIAVRIIGGSNARVNEFPWQTSIQLLDPAGGPATPFCGGAILDNTHILTAAHCIQPEELSTIVVVAGAHSVFSPDGTEQSVRVAAWEYHENFDPVTYDFDIAIIRLASPLTFNSRVGSIALPPQNFEPSGSCVNTGWGNIRNDGGTEYPELLQKVTLQMVDRRTCEDRYAGVNQITMGMICSGDKVNQGSCKGDSGGPLVCTDNNGNPYLAGLVSWGVEPCAADPKYPSVFTNVAYFINWIFGTK